MSLQITETSATGSVGLYRIVRPFRVGGGILTAQAMHLGTDAIVVLRAQYELGGTDAVMRHGADFSKRLFLNEAAILNRVNHPHVIRCHGIYPDDDVPHFALQWVKPGTNCLDWLKSRRDTLSKRELIDFAPRLCSAVDAVHSASVIHRDISPLNVVVQDGKPFLVDFGYACSMDEDEFTPLYSETVSSGIYYGSPGLIAPEFFIGGTLGSVQSDVWSLAATLMFMHTGRMVFDLMTEEQRSHLLRLSGQKPPDFRIADLADPDVYEVLTRALEVDPSRRTQTAAELGAQLSALSA
ncbi:MAG: serine/threonine-protein kinase [Bdellovibrionota bacterium]